MRRFPVILLVLVCMVSGLQWLLAWNGLALLRDSSSLALGAILAALVTGLWFSTFGQKVRISDLWSWKLTLSGVGTFGIPALLLLLGRQQFNSVMAVATQASVPVVVAITSGAVQPESELQTQLMPGLAALAGTLLVLPVALPQSSSGWSGFLLYLAAACLSGVSSVFCHREMVRVPHGMGLLFVIVSNAIWLGIVAVLWLSVSAQWQGVRGLYTVQNIELVLMTAVSMIAVAALLQSLPPLATASRVVFAPLITTFEAFVFLRPTVSLRTICGALLMLLGGLACLYADREQRSPGTVSLR